VILEAGKSFSRQEICIEKLKTSNENSVEFLKHCFGFCKELGEFSMYLSDYAKKLPSKEEDAQALLLDSQILNFYLEISLNLRFHGTRSVIKQSVHNQNIIDYGEIGFYIKAIPILNNLLFQSLKIVREEFTQQIASPTFVRRKSFFDDLDQHVSYQKSKEKPNGIVKSASPVASHVTATSSTTEVKTTQVVNEQAQHLRQELEKEANAAGIEVGNFLENSHCLQIHGFASGVRLFEFLTENPKWKQTDIAGCLILLHYKQAQEYYLQISDIKTLETLFLFKVTKTLEYTESDYYFHRFKTPSGYNAFSFFFPAEAKPFLASLRQCLAAL
jgi:hypothetical protein